MRHVSPFDEMRGLPFSSLKNKKFFEVKLYEPGDFFKNLFVGDTLKGRVDPVVSFDLRYQGSGYVSIVRNTTEYRLEIPIQRAFKNTIDVMIKILGRLNNTILFQIIPVEKENYCFLSPYEPDKIIFCGALNFYVRFVQELPRNVKNFFRFDSHPTEEVEDFYKPDLGEINEDEEEDEEEEENPWEDSDRDDMEWEDIGQSHDFSQWHLEETYSLSLPKTLLDLPPYALLTTLQGTPELMKEINHFSRLFHEERPDEEESFLGLMIHQHHNILYVATSLGIFAVYNLEIIHVVVKKGDLVGFCIQGREGKDNRIKQIPKPIKKIEENLRNFLPSQGSEEKDFFDLLRDVFVHDKKGFHFILNCFSNFDNAFIFFPFFIALMKTGQIKNYITKVVEVRGESIFKSGLERKQLLQSFGKFFSQGVVQKDLEGDSWFVFQLPFFKGLDAGETVFSDVFEVRVMLKMEYGENSPSLGAQEQENVFRSSKLKKTVCHVFEIYFYPLGRIQIKILYHCLLKTTKVMIATRRVLDESIQEDVKAQGARILSFLNLSGEVYCGTNFLELKHSSRIPQGYSGNVFM